MALRDRLSDFGAYIPGAAKDRWRTWGDRMNGPGSTLAEIFPDPPYTMLLEDGFEPKAVAFLRAMRDSIPARPSKSWKVRPWEQRTRQVAQAAASMMSASAEGVNQALDFLQFNKDAMAVFGHKAGLYEILGHEKSLRGYEVRMYAPPLYGAPPDPDRLMLVKGGRLIAKGSLDVLAEAVREDLGLMAAARKPAAPRSDMRLRYLDKLPSGRFDPQGSCQVTVKIGRNFADLPGAVYPSVKAGRAALIDDRPRLEGLLARLREIPSERYPRNAPRMGPPRREGEITRETFLATLPMRGVQFGNSMELHRRQTEMSQAWDAFHDLAQVLGVPPERMTLGSDLALAFGARGKGGRNAAKAHYEPGERVINLTNRNGAGSLGHEWVHGEDDALGRAAGRGTYATLVQGTPLHAAMSFILARTELAARAARLDEVRTGKPYWSTRIEMAARSFETWLRLRLHIEGIRNDYLVNFVEKEDYDLMDLADLTGAPARYPYPTMEELPVVDQAFSVLFGREPATAAQLSAYDRDRHMLAAMASAVPAPEGEDPEEDFGDAPEEDDPDDSDLEGESGGPALA